MGSLAVLRPLPLVICTVGKETSPENQAVQRAVATFWALVALGTVILDVFRIDVGVDHVARAGDVRSVATS